MQVRLIQFWLYSIDVHSATAYYYVYPASVDFLGQRQWLITARPQTWTQARQSLLWESSEIVFKRSDHLTEA